MCETTWIYEPFHRAWRYLVSPAAMLLRWVITLVSFRQVDLITVGWRRRTALNWGIAAHWVIVGINSAAAGALVLW